MTEYPPPSPHFWERDPLTPEEERKRAELIGKEIEVLKLQKETASKHVDFGNEEFDVVVDWDRTSGLAVVADLMVDKRNGLPLSHILLHFVLVGRGRRYLMPHSKGVKDTLRKLKRDLARELKNNKIEKLGVEEVYSLLEKIDKEKAAQLERHKFKAKEIGFDTKQMETILERERIGRENQFREELEESRRRIEELEQEKKALEQYLEKSPLPRPRWEIDFKIEKIETEIEAEKDLVEVQNEYSTLPFQNLGWNYLVEYDPKREIALVANCGLEGHMGCWSKLEFSNVALIGKTWHNFLPPAYANKSIDEGIRWMCWMEKGDYFVKEV